MKQLPPTRRTVKLDESEQRMAREYDSPWKLVLAVYFERFIKFFYPGLHSLIDWSEPPVSLD